MCIVYKVYNVLYSTFHEMKKNSWKYKQISHSEILNDQMNVRTFI